MHLTSGSDWDARDEELSRNIHLLQQSPSDPRLNRKVAYLLFQRGRFSEAVYHYRVVAQIEPGNAQAWYELGSTAIRARDLVTAQEALSRAIERGRDDGVTHAALASVLHDSGQVEPAIEQARRAMELPLNTWVRGELCRMLGTWCGEVGDHEGALVHLIDAVLADPDDAAAQHNLGATYAQRGRFTAALPYLERATELAPQAAMGWYHLGRAAREAGAMERARDALEKAVSMQPQDGDIRAELAYVLLSLDQPKAATEHGRLGLELPLQAHSRAWIHGILAASAHAQGDPTAEIRYYRAAVAAAPENAHAHHNLGAAYCRSGKYGAAVRELRRAAALDPERAGTWRQLAVAAASRGDLRTADRAAEKAITHGESADETRAELVHALLGAEQWDAAAARGQALLSATSDAALATWLHRALAYCERRRGNYSEAIRHVREVLSTDHGEAADHYNLACAYRALKYPETALAEARRAAELDPDDEETRLLLDQLWRTAEDRGED